MRSLIIAGLTASLLLGACGEGDGPSGREANGRVQIVAGFYPLAEAAAEIGGDRVEVVNLTPPGSEAHDVELTTAQVDAVLDADLVLMLGGGFQPALEAAVERREGRTLDLLSALGESAADEGHVDEEAPDPGESEDHAHEHGEDDGESDPHVWLDPRKFGEMVAEIGRALEDSVAPSERSEVQARAAAFAERIHTLDLEFEAGLKRCERREIVTTHAAFGHLATAYRLRQEPISGLSPGAEPEPSRVAELTELIRRTGASAIFVEPLVPGESAEVLARESGVRTLTLNPLEGLAPSDLESGADYESVMRANLAALREGLACQ